MVIVNTPVQHTSRTVKDLTEIVNSSDWFDSLPDSANDPSWDDLKKELQWTGSELSRFKKAHLGPQKTSKSKWNITKIFKLFIPFNSF